ncbi:MAG: DUF4350 domain-containing protein [Egibacteraceae bacterium]
MKLDRQSARRLLLPGLLLAGILVAALLAGPDGQPGPPLSPRSTGPLGTKALVDLLSQLGVEVQVSDGVPATPVALLLADMLDDARRDGLRGWVERGGRLIVTDPGSTFAPEAVGDTVLGLIDPTIAKRCDLPALRDVERIAAPGGAVYEPGAGDGCFPRNGGVWLVVRPMGEGTVVALGGPAAFVNERLGRADNALLAVALLGGGVTLLEPPGPGEGDATLADLLDPRVRVALVQLAVAFLLVVAWRARRLGRPVREPVPVRIPASELVIAVGNLLAQAGGRTRGAALLRDDLRRQLADRLGLPASAPLESLAAAASARAAGRLDAAAVRSALDGPVPRTEEELVALARQLERVRRLVLGEPWPPTNPSGQRPDSSS